MPRILDSWRRWTWLGLICLMISAAPAGPLDAQAAENRIDVIQLSDDTINPITAEYITRAIDRAAADSSQCLILLLDTPGGLLTSTRQIVKKILAAPVPVVVYIAPSGARAGSAGVFITYAAHVAAMAPSTNIGAAHPVSIGGSPGDKSRSPWQDLKDFISKPPRNQDQSQQASPAEGEEGSDAKPASAPDTNEDILAGKILHDTVAFIKALAQQRGRNVDWAVKSVTESASITETEALEIGVVDLIAPDLPKLITALDGREITLDQGQTVTLQTKDAVVVRFAMDARQRLFNVLANPNIAYILMLLGFYGLVYEVTHPGFGVPGILGAVFLILAFFSMQTLPTNYAGLALVLLGLGLFIAEGAAPGLGIFFAGGLVSLALGAFLLFDAPDPVMRISLPLIIGTSLGFGIFFAAILRGVIQALRRRVATGPEGMIGLTAEVYRDMAAGQSGKVYVHGELWNAVCSADVKKGDTVRIRAVNGMVLRVEPFNERNAS